MNQESANIEAWTRKPFSSSVQKEASDVLNRFKKGANGLEIEAFTVPLEFGTGGIRGRIGNGIGRMNEYTVGRAALGFSRYLVKKSKKPVLVIAYDSRRRSREFAEVTAGIAASHGIKVYLFPEVAPTPLLSYAVRYYKATGGVVLTASHNPPEYNGFKAYLSKGEQLVPPDDKKIIGLIESIQDWNEIEILTTKDPRYKKFVKKVEPACFASYLKDLKKAGIQSEQVTAKQRASLKLVYSPLHGTGGKYMKFLLNTFGYKQVILVPEQKDPNGEFPTVKYPNPEEAEALELSLKLSQKIEAKAFIATDPDADRLGIGVRNLDGSYTLLNGNQIGSILAAYLSEKVASKKRKGKKPVLVKTIVTTDLQSEIAKKNKIALKNVLTGFKYIAEVMGKLDESKTQYFLFGGEESYGYLPVNFVRDKDSLSSALLLLEVLAEKENLTNYMNEIYLKYGLYQESLKSLNLEGLAGKKKIQDSLDSLRNRDLIGQILGKRKVIGFLDYKNKIAKGVSSKSAFSGLPSSDVIQLELEGSGKLTIRPSGTEPKIKIYSSFKSLRHPNSKEEIPALTRTLSEELKQTETVFLKIAGLS
ncbi:phosphoglucomutase/phosphomannomutase, alpha/beta/alpha domain I [Leptospira inadai serovar Lyme str. 10]|uniref:Phosphoglucomutase/phosphomannomutase, alpha/beta/alpha domain I n=2 Tax=Leptospira inadai serovar Lyme TaxID=293084 RepID=V6HJX4_9LEPT|nr:phospho-sugar mutase [Leptospira inadai]EQA37195.1 phosphoglucomutase/phosphomannomutase, alpha/beta/alpha domain I [Leptospira inadai serovar Lyme str. 10]PNV76615.1 phospho-sugar mutase [Leptospira inadai serovar Lyme]